MYRVEAVDACMPLKFKEPWRLNSGCRSFVGEMIAASACLSLGQHSGEDSSGRETAHSFPIMLIVAWPGLQVVLILL